MRKLIIRAIIFLAWMFMSSGCARNIEITSGTPTLVLKPLEETTEVSDLSEYISEVELIRMGTDSNVIPSISKLIPTRDCFFLISGGVVFSMSKDGSKIQKIGRVGRGPGEYLSIKDISLDYSGNGLLCLDTDNSIIRYDFSTSMATAKYDPGQTIGYARAVFPISEDQFALFVPNPLDNGSDGNKKFYCLQIYDNSPKLDGKEIEWSGFNADIGFSIPVSMDSDKFILAPTSSTPAIVFKDGEEVGRIFFDFGRKSVPKGYFTKDIGMEWDRISALFEEDRYKFVSSIYFPDGQIYFQAFGKESSLWNFMIDLESKKGIRWQSIGSIAPPVSAIASEDGYLYFPYCEYGMQSSVDENDPLRKYVIGRFGLPRDNASYIVKIKIASRLMD